MPLWKDLDPNVDIVSVQETGSILKIGFALSKRPHLHMAYLGTVCSVLTISVSKYTILEAKKLVVIFFK